MKKLITVILVVLVALGIASGIAKILLVPEEVEFFHGQMGFSTMMIVIFGVTQCVAALCLVFAKTRTAGAAVLALTFLLSAIIIFMAGKTGFGVFSLLPVALAGLVVAIGLKKSAQHAPGVDVVSPDNEKSAPAD